MYNWIFVSFPKLFFEMINKIKAAINGASLKLTRFDVDDYVIVISFYFFLYSPFWINRRKWIHLLKWFANFSLMPLLIFSASLRT